jgi:hypothetical protein
MGPSVCRGGTKVGKIESLDDRSDIAHFQTKSGRIIDTTMYAL